jgi:uncharacterized protein (TIGR04168 family)
VSPLDVAVLGDLHGDFSLREDGPALEQYQLILSTGDLTPNSGRDRFDVALRLARELAELRAYTILGNHDGPSGFTGRSFPKSFLQLEEALGPFHAAMRVIELPELGLSLVGARPLSMGGDDLKYVPPGTGDRTMADWADALTALLLSARGERIVVLAHDGPKGLGAARDAIFGCDFRAEAGDWGDTDLQVALGRALDAGRPVVAVIAGHMHHALRGGGERTWQVRHRGVLHVNAAIVPRVTAQGRAHVVVTIDGRDASASVRWA